MKKLFIYSSCLIVSLLGLAPGSNAQTGFAQWWDNNGTSPAGSGIWDTTTPNWTTSATLTASTVAFTNGNFALFSAGSGAVGSNTITVATAVTAAGIGNSTSNGTVVGAAITNLAFSGPGSINLPPGPWSIECGATANTMYFYVPITGPGGIVQHNNGAFELLGTNTYSGGTTVTGGQILWYNNNASFGTGPITNTGASSLEIVAGVSGVITLPNAIALNTASVLNFASGNTTCTGPVTLGATTQLKNNGASTTTLTMSGPISGAFGINYQCANGGKMVLSGPNTYTGATAIGTSGTATIVSVSNINSVTSPAQQTSSSLGKPSSAAAGTIAIGSTTVGATMIYTGVGETSDRVINLAGTTGGATLEMDGAGPLVLTQPFTATGAGSKTLTLQGTSTATNTVMGPIVDNSSANKTALTKAQAGNWVLTGTNTYSGNMTISGGALTIGGAGEIGSGSYAGTIADTASLVYNSSLTQTLGGVISGTAGTVTVNGTGKLILTAANTYTGTTTVNGSGSTLQLGDGATKSGTVAAGISVSNTANLILAPGGAAITYSGATQIISGTGAVTMNGPGTFIIGANHNTYTGGTVINGGILQTGGDQTSGGAAANLGTTPSSFQAANITLNGGILQGNNPNFAFMSNRGITLTANSGLSAIVTGNALAPAQGELGIQGVITDNNAGFGITITGQTNLTTGLLSGVYLEGANTYTGPTVVASGILSLYFNGSINSSSSLTINSGAAFDVSSNSANPWNLSQPLNANGSGVGLPGFYTLAPTTAALFVGASGGTINFGSQNLNLTITPTNFTGDGNQPALYVSQGSVTLNGNVVSVTNNGTSPLGYGVYTLIQQAGGSMSVLSAPTLAGVAGNGIIGTATASLVVNGGALNLIVAPNGSDPNSPYFSNVTPASGFTYGSATSILLSGTVSNLSGGIATAGDTINVQVGTMGAQAATIGANGSFSINYSLPAFTAAGSYPIAYTYSGTLGSASDTSTALQIAQALLSVSASDPSRNWNGTTAATVVLTPSPLNGDSVTIAGTGATNFATSNPGNSIPVTITSLRLTGSAAGNYYLASSTYTLTGNILTPSFTWNGLDSITNNNFQWGDQFNWVGNIAPDLIGDSLDFAGATGLAAALQSPYTNWALTFDSTAGAFAITNLGNFALSIGPGGITNNSTSAQTIGVPVNTLTSSSSQWYVTNGGSLLMIRNVTDAGGGITLAGAGTLNLSGSNNAITGPLTNLAGTILFTGGTKLNNASYAGAISNNGTVNFNSTSNQTLSGVISGSGNFILAGTGTLTLSGANTYTGQTIVSNGSLVIGKDSNLGTPPVSPVANSIVLNNFINGGANDYGLRDTGGTFTLNANRGIFLGPLGGSINVQNAITLTVAGVISGPGNFYASPNNSAGFGTIVLTANNTYTGGTFIGAGVLQLGVNGALPTGTPLTVNQSSGTVAATLDMNGFSQTIGPLQSAQFGGAGTFLPTIKLSGALTVLQTNTTTTFGGAMISSGGNLTIATAFGGVPGTLILTGTNTYTGNTAINAGTLALSTLGSISNSANISIAAGGTFDVSALTSSTYNLSASTSLSAAGTGAGPGTTAAVIIGAASGTVNLGSQPISLTFTPTAFTGDTAHPALYVSQGTLQLNNNAITVNNAGAQPLGAGTYTLVQQASGSVSGTPSAAVTITGSGLAAGATGSISVSGGVVSLVVTGSTPPSPTINSVVRSGGNLILSGTNGPDNGTYVVLSSTNVALPVNLWTPVSTNTFSPTGAFSVTNSITGNRDFFIIQIP
jgi:fibronectin-binding autotransporter adhesin